MMPIADAVFPQTDENIAAVLTYTRNAFGNSASAVTPEMVAAHRGEEREGMLTVKDLIDPKDYVAPPAPGGTLPVLSEIPSTGLNAPIWMLAIFLVVLGLSVVTALGMKAKS